MESKWVSIPSLPRARAFGGFAALGGRVFLFGGLEQSYVSSALCFDPVTSVWSSIAPMNSIRVMCAGVTLGGRIYAIGGEGADNKAVRTVEIYDPLTNAWTMAAPLLAPRTHMAATTYGGQIFVFGGRTTGSNMVNRAPPHTEPHTHTQIRPCSEYSNKLCIRILVGCVGRIGRMLRSRNRSLEINSTASLTEIGRCCRRM